ncbi:hypothetical protein [Actinomycetospora termitidis]|uniref:Integral membrane protein n=1 Tax=Actinomycetospora termitidis TaxID=3053470 RepID=A0ABT7M5K5_9PSEU|nr:hypothetical protein [Actinomycetospora sp. Odt1-22]MDL5155949.1 hypothetical protein [Actinomycetospora sp. Odt1-22]
MTTTTEERMSTRRYLTEFGTAMAAYVVVVVISGAVVRAHPDAGWRYVVAVTPLVPAVLATVVVLRHVGRLDELERRIQLEALAFAALLTGLATFTWGFVELAGAPAMPLVWVLPMLVALWGVGQAVARRRYR